jgi:hypothetical protein
MPVLAAPRSITGIRRPDQEDDGHTPAWPVSRVYYLSYKPIQSM